jgi:hypothetical protein
VQDQVTGTVELRQMKFLRAVAKFKRRNQIGNQLIRELYIISIIDNILI